MDIACHLKIRLFLLEFSTFFFIVVKQVDVPLGME
jgi:hypothetical protein